MNLFSPARLVWQDRSQKFDVLQRHSDELEMLQRMPSVEFPPQEVDDTPVADRILPWEAILDQLTMNRRLFLQIIGLLGLPGIASLATGCLPALPPEDWKLPERIDKQNPLFMELRDNRGRHDNDELNKPFSLDLLFNTLQQQYSQELGAEYAKLRDEYVKHAIGEIRGFDGLLQLLLDNEFKAKHPKVVAEFPDAWANFLPTFEKQFPEILDNLFKYLLGTFDPFVLLEFMQHLKKKRFGAGFLRKIFMGDDEKGIDRDRVDIHEIKQSFHHGVINPNHVRGERMKQYIPSLLMYVMTKDLVPSIHTSIGGRALASWAASMACLEGMDVNEVDAHGKEKMIGEEGKKSAKRFYAPQPADKDNGDHYRGLFSAPYLEYQAVIPILFSSGFLTMDQKRQLFFGFRPEDYEQHLKPYIFKKLSAEAEKNRAKGKTVDVEHLGLEAARFIKKSFSDLNAKEKKEIQDFMIDLLKQAIQSEIDAIVAAHKQRYDSSSQDIDKFGQQYFQSGDMKHVLEYMQRSGATAIIQLMRSGISDYHTNYVKPAEKKRPRPAIASYGDIFFSNSVFDGNDLNGRCDDKDTPQIERKTRLPLPKLAECVIN